MNTKERIAKALYEHDYARVHWKWGGEDDMVIPIRKAYLNDAEAVIKELEVDIPKSLMDCLLSVKDLADINADGQLFNRHRFGEAVAEAQLEKCRTYIEKQVEIKTAMALADKTEKPETKKYIDLIHPPVRFPFPSPIAETPKELKDCLLGVHERVNVLDEGNWDIYDDEQYKLYCEAQLKSSKLKAFINLQVKAEKIRITEELYQKEICPLCRSLHQANMVVGQFGCENCNWCPEKEARLKDVQR